MVVFPANLATISGRAAGAFESHASPGLALAQWLFGRGLTSYLLMARTNSLGSYSVYLEEMLAVLVIIFAYSATAAQAKRPARFIVPPVLVTFLKLFAQPVAVLAQEIRARGRRLRPGYNNYPTSLDAASSQMLIASPHATLNDLLRELEAGGGFIAVQQGSCFAVVASVNSLPVGHRLEMSGAAAADHLRLVTFDARIAPPGRREEAAAEPESYPTGEFERMVEHALKALSDYTVLGQSGLASRLWLEPAAKIEQAKVLRGILVDAIESLRPAGNPPKGVLPREWQAYTILRDAYVDDVPNRDIMSKLYISEGTFNRQRRKALRAVAIAIWEVRQSYATTVAAEDGQDSWSMPLQGQLADSKL